MDLLQKLKELMPTGVKIQNNRIYAKIGDYELPSRRIVIQPHNVWVGSNTFGWNKGIVFVDDDIIKLMGENTQDEVSICFHESTEGWEKNRLFPHKTVVEVYPIIHDVAELLERKWHVRHYGEESWGRYMRNVNYVWKKERDYWREHSN